MERVNKILQDDLFAAYLQKTQKHESDRVFCRHNLSHLLDVSRIAWIMNLEQGLGLDKELVYAAGLLHDIGRWVQYETGEDHALASERLCGDILVRCGYRDEEIEQIKKAIRNHRVLADDDLLCRIIFDADEQSRNCGHCQAIRDCKKPKSDGWLAY